MSLRPWNSVRLLCRDCDYFEGPFEESGLWRQWPFGGSDLALSGLVPSFPYCQFSCGRNRRDEVAADVLAEVQSRLSVSLLAVQLAWSSALHPPKDSVDVQYHIGRLGMSSLSSGD